MRLRYDAVSLPPSGTEIGADGLPKEYFNKNCKPEFMDASTGVK